MTRVSVCTTGHRNQSVYMRSSGVSRPYPYSAAVHGIRDVFRGKSQFRVFSSQTDGDFGSHARAHKQVVYIDCEPTRLWKTEQVVDEWVGGTCGVEFRYHLQPEE